MKLEQDKQRINFIQRSSKLPLAWLRPADDYACLWTCVASGKHIKLNLTLWFHNTDHEDLFNVLVLFAIVFTMPLNYSDLVYYMPQNMANRMVKMEYICARISGWLRHTMFRIWWMLAFWCFSTPKYDLSIIPSKYCCLYCCFHVTKHFCIVLAPLLLFDLALSCTLYTFLLVEWDTFKLSNHDLPRVLRGNRWMST